MDYSNTDRSVLIHRTHSQEEERAREESRLRDAVRVGQEELSQLQATVADAVCSP